MTPTQSKAMEDARNALQRAAYTTDRPDILGLCEQADDALRAALAEAEEPVAWLRKNGFRFLEAAEPQDDSELPLYTHPPRREALTEEQIDAMSLREAAEKALEALEITTAFVDGCPIDWGRGYVPEADEAITTLRTALAEAEKPPRREPLTEGAK